ncbi:hypothetical protein K7432_016230, partial [Basidiobolus ranarum]
MSGPTPDIFREHLGPTSAKCVVAIDFGTYGTGYAYAFPGVAGITEPRGSIYPNAPWRDGFAGKTKTALLLSDDNEFIAFGSAAQTKYKSLAMKGRGKLFQFFKMKLYTESVDDNITIEAENGDKVSAAIVFSESLRYIKKVASEQIQKVNSDIDPKDIKWVLTVPAIWSDAAKRVMKEAAKLAELVGTGVQLALEPEAASLWVLQSQGIEQKEGSYYMVCDCGGGTIDVTVHEVGPVVDSGRTVREVIPATGGDWGSTVVNKRILKFLEQLFGVHRYKALLNDPLGYTRLQDDVENAKISFDNESDIILVLPDTLTANADPDDLTSNETVDRFAEEKQVEFNIKGPNLCIPRKYFYDTFLAPTINTTVKHVQTILENNKKISKVVLVGNFANCIALQQSFEVLGRTKGVDIVIPTTPGEAVMRGAVLFGANPAVVTQRKARFTYGVGILKRFDDTLHSSDKLYVTSDGVRLCKDLMD